jgi:hypothetical protein
MHFHVALLLGLGVASAAPLEPRALRTSIFLDEIPAPYSQNIFLRMAATTTFNKLAIHNGDKPAACVRTESG